MLYIVSGFHFAMTEKGSGSYLSWYCRSMHDKHIPTAATVGEAKARANTTRSVPGAGGPEAYRPELHCLYSSPVRSTREQGGGPFYMGLDTHRYLTIYFSNPCLRILLVGRSRVFEAFRPTFPQAGRRQPNHDICSY